MESTQAKTKGNLSARDEELEMGIPPDWLDEEDKKFWLSFVVELSQKTVVFGMNSAVIVNLAKI